MEGDSHPSRCPPLASDKFSFAVSNRISTSGNDIGTAAEYGLFSVSLPEANERFATDY
jgi:hypothetical protein